MKLQEQIEALEEEYEKIVLEKENKILRERCNGKGTALWASEIEEFPMAVTKVRFS